MQVQRDVSQVRSQRNTWSRRRGRGTRPRRGGSRESTLRPHPGQRLVQRAGDPQRDVSPVPPTARTLALGAMRLGVLDVGSNTVHLLVVDAHAGAPPLPGVLAQDRAAAGRAPRRRRPRSRRRRRRGWSTFVTRRSREAEDKGVEEMLAFATSAMREAPNGEEVLARVARETGARPPGAVRRGRGAADLPRRTPLVRLVGRAGCSSSTSAAARWRSRPGSDEEPDAALSLPLGAGRLTRDCCRGDPPEPRTCRGAAQARPRRVRPRRSAAVIRAGAPDRVVGTSKTFRSLARITGAAPSSDGPYVRRRPRATATCTDVAARARGDDRRRSAPACPASRRAGRGSCSPARSSPTPRWTCSGRRAGDLPVGAARGRHPAPARPAAADDPRRTACTRGCVD